MPKILPFTLAALTATLCAQAPVTVTAPNFSLKAGVLMQPQYELAGSPTKDGDSQNLFLRRARMIILGNIGQDIEVFIQTDSVNYGKSAATGTKTWPDSTPTSFVLQDAVFTYKFGEELKIDAGLLVPPTSHNGTQGAATLNGMDYSTYALLAAAPLKMVNARDTGVRVRGLVNSGMFDLQLGAYQGLREAATATQVQSRNPLRVTGRMQVNLFDAETGLYYAGTYFGAKKILSFGVSHDQQEEFKSTAVDAFLDWPVNGGDVVTFQVDHWTYEGTGLRLLPKQNDLFAEGSYYFGDVKLAPLARYEKKTMDVASAANPDETRIGLGLNWWYKKHTSNLKVFWQRVKPEAPGATLNTYNQINLQWQLFYF